MFTEKIEFGHLFPNQTFIKIDTIIDMHVEIQQQTIQKNIQI